MYSVAVIPARGGSKGIPRKNVIDFCGFPLLSWSIAAAKRCPQIAEVYVSTDCPEIAMMAGRFGADVIQRPAELATDGCASETALVHACRDIERRTGRKPDVIAMLQATSPLREANELEGAFRHFEENRYDSLFSAARPEDFLMWMGEGDCLRSLNYDWRSRKRRQDSQASSVLWIETGSFYLTRSDLLLQNANRLGGRIGLWEVPLWKSFEIDSQEGLELCSLLMRNYRLDRITPAEFSRPDQAQEFKNK
jgi:CMP-N,N'-diacetyllegionaminic acid synthase